MPLGVDDGEMLPQGIEEHDTAQVTPLFAPSLFTVAVNCAALPATTVTPVAMRETVRAGTVTVTDADFVASADTAVRVTVRLLAGELGGV